MHFPLYYFIFYLNMKFHNQSLRWIIPIFIALAIIDGLLIYWFSYREIYWQIEQKISAIQASFTETIVNESALQHFTALELQEISEKNQIINIYLFNNNRIKEIFTSNQNLLINNIAAYPQNKISKQNNEFFIISHAPLQYDNSSHLVIIHNAKTFVLQQNQVNWFILLTVIGIIIIGFIITFIISRKIVYSIKKLNGAIQQSLHNQKPISLKSFAEIESLANAFNTMQSTLADINLQSKEKIYENEQFRSMSMIVNFYYQHHFPNIEKTIENYFILTESSQDPQSGDFIKLFEVKEKIYIIFGNINILQSVPILQSIQLRIKICQQFEKLIQTLTIFQILEKLSTDFPKILNNFHIIQIEKSIIHYLNWQNQTIQQQDYREWQSIFFHNIESAEKIAFLQKDTQQLIQQPFSVIKSYLQHIINNQQQNCLVLLGKNNHA